MARPISWEGKHSLLHEVYRNRYIYLYLLPTFILLAVFQYFPPISAMYHAFFDWNGADQSIFIGLGNFREMLGDKILLASIKNMLIMMGIGIPLSTFMPLVAAELIFNLRSEWKRNFYRMLFLVPTVVPGMVYILLWKFIYDPQVGFLNALLGFLGLEEWQRAWLGDVNTALYAVIFKNFPWVWGIGILIYLAGLQTIDLGILDAAKIDGATTWKRILKVDIPLVMGQVKFFLITGIISAIQGYTDVLILTNGGPGWATMVPGLHMYQNAFTYNRMGYATAIGLAMFVAILILTVLNMKYIRTNDDVTA